MLLNIFKVGPAPALLRILDRLLIRLVAHRSPETVSGYMTSLSSSPDHYYFRAQSGSRERAESVRGTVLLVLGTWTLMKKYFTPSPLRPTRIELAYSLQNERGPSEDESQRRPPTGTFHQGLQQLVVESGLLPHPNEEEPVGAQSRAEWPYATSLSPDTRFGLHVGLVDSHRISSRRLNAPKLWSLAGIHIVWTENICRHLLLSKSGARHSLEVFALPCALRTGPRRVLSQAGIPETLGLEVRMSYANLFNPLPASAAHRKVFRYLGLRRVCWCLSCASWRLARRAMHELRSSQAVRGLPYDPEIKELMTREPEHWDQVDFKNLWPRILALDQHLQEARPWNFWVLFRDNRETVQYWTFL